MRLFRCRWRHRTRKLAWRADPGMSSLEMAILAAGLLAMATAVILALQGKLDSLMSTFTSTST